MVDQVKLSFEKATKPEGISTKEKFDGLEKLDIDLHNKVELALLSLGLVPAAGVSIETSKVSKFTDWLNKRGVSFLEIGDKILSYYKDPIIEMV